LQGFCLESRFCLLELKLLWITLSLAALKILAPPSALRHAIMTTMTTLSPPLSPSTDYSPSGGPRALSTLSSHSRRSRRSSSAGAKLDLTETHADKKYLQTKADPSKAINEAQPGEPPKDNPQTENTLLITPFQPPWLWKNQISGTCAKWYIKTLQEI